MRAKQDLSRQVAPIPAGLMRSCAMLLVSLLCLLPWAGVVQAEIQYVYDETGRLVQAVDASGDTAHYDYDAAGNIAAIQRYGAGDLAITEFVPKSGPVGTTVAIYGSGFSTTAAENLVAFNGTAAVVASAAGGKLVTQVPSGATTGPISITVGSRTATSSKSFTVTTDPAHAAPVITGFSPTIGPVGTTVSIDGQNFDPIPANNTVWFNNSIAVPASSTASQIVGNVPTGATSGHIRVRTPYGNATSTGDFFVPPSGYAATQVGVATRITVDGASLPINTGSAGKIAMVLFDGVKGQILNLGVSPVAFTPSAGGAALRIYSPDGTQVFSSTFSAATDLDITPALPMSGTYTIAIIPPSTASLSATLTLSSEVIGALASEGAPIASVLRVGQNARYSFTGAAGQGFGIGVTNLATTPSGGTLTVRVYKPDGTQLTSCSISGTGGSCDVLLPADGTYSVFVDPGVYAANFNLWFTSDVTGTLAPGQTQVFSTAQVGQNARYNFSGTAGQNLSLLFSGDVFPGSTLFYVYKPDGTQLAYHYLAYSSGAGTSTTLDLTNLPATGTYSVFVTPAGTATGSMNVSLLAEASGSLSVNGGASAISLAAGQNGRYSFTGTAGQGFGIGVTNLATTPSGGTLWLTVYKPDGAFLTNCSITGTGGSCDVLLPTDGTYSVFVDPGVNAANFNLWLSADATGALVPGGTQTFNTTLVGQNARYTFSGTAGQNLSLLFSGDVFPGNTLFYVYKPDGTQLAYSYLSYSSGAGVSTTVDLTNLPATGTYSVFVTPQGTATGSLNVSLQAEASGALSLNGGAMAVSLAAGQNGRYTFTGTAGQGFGIGVTNLATMPSDGTLSVKVYKPDGNSLTTCSITGTGGSCDLLLPADGTYSVFADPGVNAASFNLWFSSDATGTLAPGQTQLFSTARIGQNARYTFSGTAGQNLSLLFSGDVFPGNTLFYVYKPDGTQLAYSYLSYSSGAGVSTTVDLTNLPATGTYSVFVTPQGTATGSLSVSLQAEASGPLPVDVGATAVSLAAGQNGRYTFTGTAGQGFGIGVTNLATTPAGGTLSLTVYKPDGAYLTSCSISGTGGSCDVLLPVYGTYSVFVDAGVKAASFDLWLSADVTGTLTTGGGAQTFSTTLVGQNARYSFSGTAAQSLSLYFSGDVFPGYTYVYVYKPDGTQFSSTFLNYVSGNGASTTLNLTNLPATGTYKVLVTPSGTATGSINVQIP